MFTGNHVGRGRRPGRVERPGGCGGLARWLSGTGGGVCSRDPALSFFNSPGDASRRGGFTGVRPGRFLHAVRCAAGHGVFGGRGAGTARVADVAGSGTVDHGRGGVIRRPGGGAGGATCLDGIATTAAAAAAVAAHRERGQGGHHADGNQSAAAASRGGAAAQRGAAQIGGSAGVRPSERGGALSARAPRRAR
eukprot:ctg_2089.g559